MDRNINEKIRKPRRTKGTPFFVQRNYYAAGVILFGALSWALYELWPESRKLKKNFLEGKFDPHPEIKERFLHSQLALKPGYSELMVGLKARKEAREDALYQDESQPQPWFTKFNSQPDV